MVWQNLDLGTIFGPPELFDLLMKLLLIDGHYYAYRSFFAIRDLKNSRGEPVSAIYGFVKAVRKMVRDLSPDYGAVVWDRGIPLRRAALQPAYKQQRAEMPENMRSQLVFLQNLLPLLGFTGLSLPETEADDLIASYAVAATAEGHEVFVATRDKDLFQLVNDRVKIYSTIKADFSSPKDTFALLGVEAVAKKWGIPPWQIAEMLALTGDQADNIPGVFGLGVKGAVALLANYGPLDAILANPNAIENDRLRDKVQTALEQIEQNREMIRLDLDLPLPTPIDELKILPRWQELIAELEKCDLKSLIAEVRAEEAGVNSRVVESTQGELF